MSQLTKIAYPFAALTVAALALAGCTTEDAAPAAETTPTPIETVEPTPEYLTELPEWAQESTWLIYPEGFECEGTEGCPNSYTSIFGEPGPVLPEGVEYYNPATHDCVLVAPKGEDCAP